MNRRAFLLGAAALPALAACTRFAEKCLADGGKVPGGLSWGYIGEQIDLRGFDTLTMTADGPNGRVVTAFDLAEMNNADLGDWAREQLAAHWCIHGRGAGPPLGLISDKARLLIAGRSFGKTATIRWSKRG